MLDGNDPLTEPEFNGFAKFIVLIDHDVGGDRFQLLDELESMVRERVAAKQKAQADVIATD